VWGEINPEPDVFDKATPFLPDDSLELVDAGLGENNPMKDDALKELVPFLGNCGERAEFLARL
jgi:hypothetical protein